MKFRLIAAVCAALLTSAVVPARTATLDEIARMPAAEREAALVEGARREGKVMIYSAMIEDQALRPMMAAFRAKYPFIDAQFLRVDTRELINRTLAEVRARAVTVDVVEGGSISPALTRAGVVQPFHLPILASIPQDVYDPKGMWAATRLSYFGLAYNTKLVRADEAPRTYEDLLDPKWSGKMAWAAASETGGAIMFLTALRKTMGEEKGEAFIRKLADQKIINATGSAREIVNKTMAGEFSISLGIFLHHPIISAQKGAPVAPLPLEPVYENASVMLLLKQAPHPHAAILLMDFLMSKKGQEVIRDAEYFPSDPQVETSKALDPIIPAKAGLKHIFLSEDELFAGRVKSLDLQKKLFQN